MVLLGATYRARPQSRTKTLTHGKQFHYTFTEFSSAFILTAARRRNLSISKRSIVLGCRMHTVVLTFLMGIPSLQVRFKERRPVIRVTLSVGRCGGSVPVGCAAALAVKVDGQRVSRTNPGAIIRQRQLSPFGACTVHRSRGMP